MNRHSRRTFLKKSVSAGALAAIGAAPEAVSAAQARRAKTPLSKDTLQAIAEVVLPTNALKQDGVTRIVADFEKWLDAFEPVAEQEHAYLSSSEIVYGPPDPRGLWQAQLDALDLVSQKETGKAFRALSVTERRRLIERALRGERLERFPAVAEAAHVTIALTAFFYSTPEANDLCYEASIGRWQCRGLDSAPQKPTALTRRG